MVGKLGLLVAILTAAQPVSGRGLSAQDNGKVATEKPFCFRGQALPRCRAFAITEFGGDVRLYAPKIELVYVSPFDSSVIRYEYRPTVFSVTGEVGAMYNTSKRNALGGSVFSRNGSGGARFGVKGRYRHWLSTDGIGARCCHRCDERRWRFKLERRSVGGPHWRRGNQLSGLCGTARARGPQSHAEGHAARFVCRSAGRFISGARRSGARRLRVRGAFRDFCCRRALTSRIGGARS